MAPNKSCRARDECLHDEIRGLFLTNFLFDFKVLTDYIEKKSENQSSFSLRFVGQHFRF